MAWNVEARDGIFLPRIGWHLDARRPVERCFVSHAHFDHLGAHRTILCSRGTARLMAARLPGEREEIILDFGEEHRLEDGTRMVLHPAGHVFGSAQLLVENELGSLLYTGDFKLRPGLSAEPCATPHADTLIMETTYGRPHYVLPPSAEVMADIVRFCQNAIADGEVPVLFGYSLGKSQEILRGLTGAGLEVMMHSQAWKMTRIYEQLGVAFPPHRKFDLGTVAGHVVICPPQSAQSPWLRKIKPRRTASITGWALDPGAIYRMQCDAVFPLSDHAGFDDLLRFVERVQPLRVFTVHGFAADFARTLRARGIEAWALGESNQLELPLAAAPAPVAPLAAPSSPPAREATAGPPPAAGSFLAFASACEAVRTAVGKLEKVRIVAEFLAAQNDDTLGPAALFFTGRPFPQSSDRALQLGWAVIKRAVLSIVPVSEGEFRQAYSRSGDTGTAVGGLLAGRTQPEPWSLQDAAGFLDGVGRARGPLGKIEQLEACLRRLHPLEATYLIKVITGDLRIGLKEGLVEEAVAQAFGRELEAVREANMRSGDIGRVALAARAGELAAIELTVFHPLQFMLASPEPDAESIVARLGDQVWLEEKYDGIRCQVHKHGREARLFSRDLRDISPQFPELVDAARACEHDFIADGELLAWRDGRALSFFDLQRRLGRRGDDFFLGQEVPVSLWLYDLLWLDGRNLLREPLRLRRAALEALPFASSIVVAPKQVARGAAEVEAAFRRARERGNEGLMAKDPESIYAPGRRGLAWLKLKKAGATLDVVVTGVEYGHGKRKGVLSDYTFSVLDAANGNLRTVGKAYSGLTDEEIARLTEHFLEHTLEVAGRLRRVVPNVVLEIAFDSIQPSKRHDSGFALRFPRIARIRDDKTPADIDTLETCRRLAGGGRANG